MSLKSAKTFFLSFFRELFVYHHTSLEFRAKLFASMIAANKIINVNEYKILKDIAKDLLLVDQIVELGNQYQFDKAKKVLIKDGNTIALTKKELLFISILVKNLGVFVLHEDIKKHVWTNKNVTNAAIRTFIKRIREKTGKEFIKNVPGLGYKINTNL